MIFIYISFGNLKHLLTILQSDSRYRTEPKLNLNES